MDTATTTVILCGTNPSTGRGCGLELAKSPDRETAIQLAYEAGYGTHEGHFECDQCFEKRTNPKGDIARDEDFGYERNYGIEINFRTARTSHTCMSHAYCTIKPGQEYVEYVTPPWVMISDDPEGPGYRNGEFTRSRMHRYRVDHNEDLRPACPNCESRNTKVHDRKADEWECQDCGTLWFRSWGDQ